MPKAKNQEVSEEKTQEVTNTKLRAFLEGKNTSLANFTGEKKEDPVEEEEKVLPPEEMAEEESEDSPPEKHQPLSFDEVLSSLEEDKKEAIAKAFNKKEEARRQAQSTYDSKVQDLAKNVEDLKKQLDSAREELQKNSAKKLTEDTESWLSKHEGKFTEDEVEAFKSVSKDLYGRLLEVNSSLSDKLEKLEKKISEQKDWSENAILQTENDVLESVERRFTDDYDDVVAKAPDSELEPWLRTNPKAAEKFTELRKKFGIAFARCQTARIFGKVLNIQEDPDKYILKESVEAKLGKDPGEKRKVDISSVNSKSVPSQTKDNLPDSKVQRFLTKRKWG